jgi:outer membrane receptor protein involved in Fe transport
MAVSKTNRLQRRALSTALASAMLLAANAAMSQESQPQDNNTQATELDKVVVTGSLIPQTKLETFTPVTVISAEDIKVRGFTSVSDAIQQSSFATGGIQGAQTSASFTQGAETVSLFGLSVSYTKYLIDGRPMADYPALYNGSDAFNNISGIPIDLVDRIEILPGGQSSLYGSDAIAGVINIILKKQIDAPVLSIRGGTYTEGGGDSGRISAAKGFSFANDRFNLMIGAQYENAEPIWAYDRDLTRQYNTNGTTAPLAGRDWLVYSPFTSYHFLDPAGCANVADGFDGTEQLQTRPGFGDENYCGSFYSPGYRTLKNSKEAFQVYTHATYDINDKHQLYGDVLYSDEEVGYHIGSNFTWWGTSVEWGYFYDPRIGNELSDIYCGGDPACPPGALLNLQRAFTPGTWDRVASRTR